MSDKPNLPDFSDLGDSFSGPSEKVTAGLASSIAAFEQTMDVKLKRSRDVLSEYTLPGDNDNGPSNVPGMQAPTHDVAKALLMRDLPNFDRIDNEGSGPSERITSALDAAVAAFEQTMGASRTTAGAFPRKKTASRIAGDGDRRENSLEGLPSGITPDDVAEFSRMSRIAGHGDRLDDSSAGLPKGITRTDVDAMALVLADAQAVLDRALVSSDSVFDEATYNASLAKLLDSTAD